MAKKTKVGYLPGVKVTGYVKSAGGCNGAPAEFKNNKRICMVIVTRNTYMRYPNVANAEPGDVCKWELSRGSYRLIRRSDGKSVFSTAPVNKDGLLRSNGKKPLLVGCIARYKGQELIVEQYNSED